MSLQGRSILIVEDEPLIAMDMVQAFRGAGAEVTITSTLKQALILVEHDGLACAVLDHALSDGTSTELCQRLNERNVPFVIYSGHGEVEGACSTGTDVNKPASMDVLTRTVEGLLPAAC